MEFDRSSLFDAKTAERHDLINRICKPADLSKESRMRSFAVMAARKNPITVRRSKFGPEQGAPDLPLSGAMAFRDFRSKPFANKPGRFATAGHGGFCKAGYARGSTQGLKDFLAEPELVQKPKRPVRARVGRPSGEPSFWSPDDL